MYFDSRQPTVHDVDWITLPIAVPDPLCRPSPDRVHNIGRALNGPEAVAQEAAEHHCNHSDGHEHTWPITFAILMRDDTEYRIPSGLGEEREAEMRELALRAYRVLGGRGWGRVDLMFDAGGAMYCLEANTSPGMTDHSLVPMAARAAGIEFPQLVRRILDEARHG